MDDLQEMLASHSGQLESSGRFTVNPARLVKAMEELDRAFPFAYLVKLLQFAFAGSPSRVDLHLTANTLRLDFTAARPSADEIGRAVGSVPAPGGPSRRTLHLRHAIALLMARPDLELSVEEDGCRMTVVAGEFELEPFSLPEAFQGPSIVRLRRLDTRTRRWPALLDFDLLAPQVSRSWPEWPSAHYFLAAPPCPVYYNGERVERRRMVWNAAAALGRADPVQTVWAIGRWATGQLPRDVPQGRFVGYAPNWEKESGVGGVRCLFRIAHGENGAPPRWWYVVQDGFIVDSFPVPQGLFPVEGWLDGSGLTTDAAFLATVRSDEWEALVEQGIMAAGEFLHYCAERIAQVRPKMGFGIASKRLAAGLWRWAEENPEFRPAEL